MKALFFFLSLAFFGTVYAANPAILYTGTNVTAFSGASPDKLIISIVATDADGIADLIGGVLLDTNGLTYGVLSSEADEGAYTISLTWKMIQDIAPINFPAGGGTKRFIVRVYDQSGGFAEAPVDVKLWCGNNSQVACNGDCKNLMLDKNNCGACGATVKSLFPGDAEKFSDGVCRNGKPQFLLDLYSPEKRNCDYHCSQNNLTCKGFLPNSNANPGSDDGYFFSKCKSTGCFGEYQYGDTIQNKKLNSCEIPADLKFLRTCYCSPN